MSSTNETARAAGLLNPRRAPLSRFGMYESPTNGTLLVKAQDPIMAVGEIVFSANVVTLLLPMALQEMVMAVWLIARGFSPSAIPSLSVQTN